MNETAPKCIKRVGKVICSDSKDGVIKYGKSKCGKQRYQCKGYRKVFIEHYTYEAYGAKTTDWIIGLTKSNIQSFLKTLWNKNQKGLVMLMMLKYNKKRFLLKNTD